MKSPTPGSGTLEVEVVQIDRHGIWLHLHDSEFFLPYRDFPWFAEAQVDHVLNVQLLHGTHLHWPDLDVDLHIDSLNDPQSYPLIAD